VGKGTHRAIDRCQEFARQYRYVLPCDIKQHFPSIDHAILRGVLTRVIHDEDVLWLCDRILESGEGVLYDEYAMVYFPGDGLEAAARPRGLPIGNLTSQFWSNCLLDVLDHFVKRELRCKAYLRYVDDLALFADDKATLWEWKQAITERLARLRLTIHEDRVQVMPVTQGIPWLGFIVFPTHRRVKRHNVLNYRRRLNVLMEAYHAGEVSLVEVDASVKGWVNHVSYASSEGLRRAVLRGVKL